MLFVARGLAVLLNGGKAFPNLGRGCFDPSELETFLNDPRPMRADPRPCWPVWPR
jgi:hypothetical protein